ncbi:MAG: AAA family ATPase [Alphaproteobacteria bacterium]|nr:AAA family ATPase [Alphaproteobacteria bacterium]
MKATLICIGGLPASGKTAIGKRLHCDYDHVKIIDPDHSWLSILGKNSKHDILRDQDIDLTKLPDVIEHMLSKTRLAIDSRKTKYIVVPSAFVLESMRQQYEKLAKEKAINFKAIWLEADIYIRKQRSNSRALQTEAGLDRGFNASTISSDNITENQFEGELTWHKIDASGNFETVYETVILYLFGIKK